MSPKRRASGATSFRASSYGLDGVLVCVPDAIRACAARSGRYSSPYTQHPIDQLVVSANVAIAKGIGKQTIAEFVADQETSDLLHTQGVDYAQAYHISRPQPVEDVLAALD